MPVRIEQQAQQILFGLFIDPKDGGSTFLRNVGEYAMDFTALHARTQYPSLSPL
jgi:hypothetical protein